MTDVKTGAALHRPGWSYIDKDKLDDFTAADWSIMEPQRQLFYAEHQAAHVLALMSLEKDLKLSVTA